ncbi:hypothetical protein [Vibrio cholerae]|nr:hypothetical protein [Vibrio cholerae]
MIFTLTACCSLFLSVYSIGSLPHRQLRNLIAGGLALEQGSLPHRQLRKFL